MRSTHRRRRGGYVLDFAATGASRRLRIENAFGANGITLVRGVLEPNPGAHIASPQIVISINEGDPFAMAWRLPGSDRMNTGTIRPGSVHVADAKTPFWLRWETRPSSFFFALDDSFVKRIWQDLYDGIGERRIQTKVGVEDKILDRLCDLGRRELDGGAGNRLYLEGLGMALAAHLLRAHTASAPLPHIVKGGLTPKQLRRAAAYIEAHLGEDFGLFDLASDVGLSAHYFGEAFKRSVGIPPHRYVLKRRIERARELLTDADHPIADIARSVGFSNQSHLTTSFW